MLYEVFSPQTSLFPKRWKCMNLIKKKEDEEFTTFLSIVKVQCKRFKLAELSPDNFNCLNFVQGLVLTKDAEIRRKVLNKLENVPNLTLQNLAEDCQRFINVRQDAKDTEVSVLTHFFLMCVKKIKWRKKNDSKPVTHVENYIFIMTVHTKKKRT